MQQTIPVNDAYIESHVGTTPSTGPFTVDFPFFSYNDVTVTRMSDGTETPILLVRGVDYTLDGFPTEDGSFSGGTVTLLLALANTTIARWRNTTIERLSNFPLQGFFSRLALNAELNRITVVLQEHDRILGSGPGSGSGGGGGGGGDAVIVPGPIPPVGAAINTLWWNSDAGPGGGQLYFLYDDGTSTAWVPASPSATNTLIQTVSFQTGAVATGTTTMSVGDVIPNIVNGDQYMTCTITPRSATSRLIIDVTWNGSHSTAEAALVVALFQDSTANALAADCIHTGRTAGWRMNMKFTHTMVSGTTSATTFRVRAGASVAGTTTFNGDAGARILGGVMASSIVIQEVV